MTSYDIRLELEGCFVPSFVKLLYRTMESTITHADNLFPQRKPFAGENTWKTWINDNPTFTDMRARSDLAKIIVGKSHPAKEQRVNNIIRTLFIKIPILKELFTIKDEKKTTVLYFMTKSDGYIKTTLQKEYASNENPYVYTNDDKKDGTTDSSAWIDVVNKTNNNTKKGKEHDKLLILNRNEKNQSKSKQNENYFASLQEKDMLNDDDNFNENSSDTPSEESDSQLVQSPIKSNSPRKHTVQPPTKAHTHTVQIDDNVLAKMIDFLHTLQDQNLDIDTLAEWINNDKIKLLENKLSSSIQAINQSTSAAIDDLHSQHSNIRKDYESTNAKCTGQLNEARMESNKAVRSVVEEGTRNVTAVAAKANEGINNIKHKIKETKQVIDDLDGAMKMANIQTRELKGLNAHVTKQVRLGYETFQNDITIQSDEAIQEFKDFINKYKDDLDHVEELKTSLEHEKEFLDLEKQFLEEEKKMVKEQLNKINEWNQSKLTMETYFKEKKKEINELISQARNAANSSQSQQTSTPHDDISHLSIPHTFNNDEHLCTQLPPQHDKPSNFPQQKFNIGQHVIYQAPLHVIHGVIVSAGYDHTRKLFPSWKYSIKSDKDIYNDCDERFIVDGNTFNSTNHQEHQQQHYPQYKRQTPYGKSRDYQLESGQYIYPKGPHEILRTIRTSHIEKHGKNWQFELKRKEDIPTFYEKLRSKLKSVNILLKAYNDITSKKDDLLLINDTNCVNHKNAKETMSTDIFNYLEDNKDTIFVQYPSVFDDIKACSYTQDGLQLLRYILATIHPKMIRESVEDDDDIPEKPRFTECTDIHDFINKYMDWLKAEKMLGRDQYSNEENIKYIKKNLDERFRTAKKKIERDLDGTMKNNLPFPDDLLVSPKLGKHILSLLHKHERDLIINEDSGGTVNKAATTHQQLYRQANTNNTPQSFNTYRNNNRRRSASGNNKDWTSNIKFEIQPMGTTCVACGNTNHEIYKTGCTIMPLFCYCNTFIQQQPQNRMKPVLEKYSQHLKDQKYHRSQEKSKYRKRINALEESSEFNDKQNATIKKIFEDEYLENNPEEQFYIHDHNIFDSSDDETPTSSDQ